MSELRRSKGHKRVCVVCGNNSLTFSYKSFFPVPKQTSIRKKWYLAINKSATPLSDVKRFWKLNRETFCCEDHFSLREDIVNLTEHYRMRGLLKLKKGAVPHIFHPVNKSQSSFPKERKKTSIEVERNEVEENSQRLEETEEPPSQFKLPSQNPQEMSQTARQWKEFKGNNLPSERPNSWKHDSSRHAFYRNSYDMGSRYYYSPNNFRRQQKSQLRRKNNSNNYNSRETKPVRPPSPFCGTEEYTLKKIQETSDMIKKQLLMSPEALKASKPVVTEPEKEEAPIESVVKKNNINSVVRNKKVVENFDVSEIHNKIMSHISNLSYGRKINLICSSSSGYDVAIQQIQKQKRLEISKALRDMCSNQTPENTDFVNSIIPDIGIKIEHLPLEVIQQLSITLDQDLLSENNIVREIKKEVVDEVEKLNDFLEPVHQFQVSIKEEPIDDWGDEVNNETSENLIEENLSNIAEIQTNLPLCCTIDTQTDEIDQFELTDTDLNPKCLQDAIVTMLRIDEEITRLTKMRQLIFSKLENSNLNKRMLKKRKCRNSDSNVGNNETADKDENEENNEEMVSNNADTGLNPAVMIDNSVEDAMTRENVAEARNGVNVKYYEKELVLGPISEKILVIKVVGNKLLAAAQSGNLFYIDLQNGSILRTIQVTSTPITSLALDKDQTHLNLFVGSLETNLKQYNFKKGNLIRCINVSAGIQCLEVSWNYIFIGTVSGDLIRYSLKKNVIEFEDNICPSAVLVLRATQEGARRVLLIGARNSPVCVRDAMSGLHMRTMDGLISPTVYSLLLENSLVYCGTTLHDILVFRFHDGALVHKHHASNAKGISCVKVVENLLFASCHNGNIYVFHAKQHKYLGIIPGPGGVILSMEIVSNLVIVGTMSFNFKSILIPNFILENNV